MSIETGGPDIVHASLFFPLSFEAMRNGAGLGADTSEAMSLALTDGDLEALPYDDPMLYLLELNARPDLQKLALGPNGHDHPKVVAYRAGLRVGYGVIGYHEQALRQQGIPAEHPAFDPLKGPVYNPPKLPWWAKVLKRQLHPRLEKFYNDSRADALIADEYSMVMFGAMKRAWTEQGRSYVPSTGAKPNEETDVAITHGVLDALELFADLHGYQDEGAPRRWQYNSHKHIRAQDVPGDIRGPRKLYYNTPAFIDPEVLNFPHDAEELAQVTEELSRVQPACGFRGYVPLTQRRELLFRRDREVNVQPSVDLWWNCEPPVDAVLTGVRWFNTRHVISDPYGKAEVWNVADRDSVHYRQLGRRDKIVMTNGERLFTLEYPFRMTPDLFETDDRPQMLRLCANGESFELSEIQDLDPEAEQKLEAFTDEVLAAQAKEARNSRIGNFMLNNVMKYSSKVDTPARIVITAGALTEISLNESLNGSLFMPLAAVAYYAGHGAVNAARKTLLWARQIRKPHVTRGPELVAPPIAES